MTEVAVTLKTSSKAVMNEGNNSTWNGTRPTII